MLLHDSKGYPSIGYQEYRWLATALATDKLGILRLWRMGASPRYCTWLEDMHKVADYEKVIYKFSDRMEVFDTQWNTFLNL